jgi:hypothetical protein
MVERTTIYFKQPEPAQYEIDQALTYAAVSNDVDGVKSALRKGARPVQLSLLAAATSWCRNSRDDIKHLDGRQERLAAAEAIAKLLLANGACVVHLMNTLIKNPCDVPRAGTTMSAILVDAVKQFKDAKLVASCLDRLGVKK